MSEKSASGILGTAIEKIRNLVDVSTIVGDPILLDEHLSVIPISKVTYGFASGGTDFPSKSADGLFGGGGGAGITISPVAFLIVKDGEVSIKHITSSDNSAERIIGMVPDVIDKVSDVVGMFTKDKAEPKEKDAAE